MRTLQLTITPELDGKTVLHVLKTHLHMSGTLIKRLKRTNSIKLSGSVAHTNVCVCNGQILSVTISEEPEVKAEPTIPILFEDEDLLILDKPAGMLVHSTKVNYNEQTIADIVRQYIGSSKFHPVNRLDRGTSGVMVVAKNGYAHNLLSDQLHTEKFCRIYLAIVCGKPADNSGIIELPIGRDSVSPIKRIVSSSGKYSCTKYNLITTNNNFSLIQAEPKTGRTHQIRLHLSALGCPIVGDFLYGTESDIINRCALHSSMVILQHPLTGRVINIESELPSDMKELLT